MKRTTAMFSPRGRHGVACLLLGAAPGLGCGAARPDVVDVASPQATLRAGVAEAPDAPPEPTEPSWVAGRWGLRVRVPISWQGSIAVGEGNDELINFLLMDLDDSPQPHARYRMCGMELPVTHSRLRPSERYQLEADNAVFDSGEVPAVADAATALAAAQPSGRGMSLASGELAFQVGVAMHDPLARSWPHSVEELDEAGSSIALLGGSIPGMRARARVGGSFRAPPASVTFHPRLNFLFLAVRNVVQLDMILDPAGSGSGTVTPQSYLEDGHARPMLNSLIVGCITSQNKACGRKMLATLNQNAPVLSARPGDVSLVRLGDDAGCLEAREAGYP